MIRRFSLLLALPLLLMAFSPRPAAAQGIQGSISFGAPGGGGYYNYPYPAYGPPAGYPGYGPYGYPGYGPYDDYPYWGGNISINPWWGGNFHDNDDWHHGHGHGFNNGHFHHGFGHFNHGHENFNHGFHGNGSGHSMGGSHGHGGGGHGGGGHHH